jgi:hypothetical protein
MDTACENKIKELTKQINLTGLILIKILKYSLIIILIMYIISYFWHLHDKYYELDTYYASYFSKCIHFILILWLLLFVSFISGYTSKCK